MAAAIRSSTSIALFVSVSLLTKHASAQAILKPSELKKLSIEELMNMEVTLVSRSPEKLVQAASAVQVITGEDIRNSSATNIAEALRLVPNLQVAHMRSNAWIISSYGSKGEGSAQKRRTKFVNLNIQRGIYAKITGRF